MFYKQLVKSGYKLYEQKYDNGVRYFCIQKTIKKNERSYLADVGIESGKKLAKMFGFKIVPAIKTSVALNYEPIAPRRGMIRTFKNW